MPLTLLSLPPEIRRMIFVQYYQNLATYDFLVYRSEMHPQEVKPPDKGFRYNLLLSCKRLHAECQALMLSHAVIQIDHRRKLSQRKGPISFKIPSSLQGGVQNVSFRLFIEPLSRSPRRRLMFQLPFGTYNSIRRLGLVIQESIYSLHEGQAFYILGSRVAEVLASATFYFPTLRQVFIACDSFECTTDPPRKKEPPGRKWSFHKAFERVLLDQISHVITASGRNTLRLRCLDEWTTIPHKREDCSCVIDRDGDDNPLRYFDIAIRHKKPEVDKKYPDTQDILQLKDEWVVRVHIGEQKDAVQFIDDHFHDRNRDPPPL